MIAFIGVRISWLMLARKSDLALVAASAVSLAATSSICARLRSVMSVKLTTAPRIAPSLKIGVAPYSTGRPGAILAPEEFIVDAARLAVRVGGEHRAFFPGVDAAIGSVVMDHAVGALADQLLRGEVQHLRDGGIDEGDPAFRIHTENALGGGIENQAVALLAGLDRLLLRDGLCEQLLGAQVALEDFEAHGDRWQQFREQRLFAGADLAKRSELKHREQGSWDIKGQAAAWVGTAPPSPEETRR